MSIEILQHTGEMRSLVQALNERLKTAGVATQIPEDGVPTWLAPNSRLGESVWREFYLAVENGTMVRGGYCIKHERFLLRGQTLCVGSVQGPFSEGASDPRYALLTFQLLRDAERRQPNLFSWGLGEGSGSSGSELLRRLRWARIMFPTLTCVINKRKFLRTLADLHKDSLTKMALTIGATTGVGAAALSVAQVAKRQWRQPSADVTVEMEFGPWADEIWSAAHGAYSFIAVRNSATLNRLMPKSGWPNATILRVHKLDRTIGWAAVRVSPKRGDARFGNLRVGSILDSLCELGAAEAVVNAATIYLKKRGADLVYTAYTSSIWIKAFQRTGYFVRPSRRMFAVSPSLERSIGQLQGLGAGLHLTPIDGDGPHGT